MSFAPDGASSSMTGGVLSSQIYMAYSRIQSIRQAAESGDVSAASAALAEGITDEQLTRAVSTPQPQTSVKGDVERIVSMLSTAIRDYDATEERVRTETAIANAAAVAAGPLPTPSPPPVAIAPVTFSVESMADVEAAANAELTALAEREEVAAVLAPEAVEAAEAAASSASPRTPSSARVTSARGTAGAVAAVAESQRRVAAMWEQTAKLVEQIRMRYAVSERKAREVTQRLGTQEAAWAAERAELEAALEGARLEAAGLRSALGARPVLSSQMPSIAGREAPVEVGRHEELITEVVEYDVAAISTTPATMPYHVSQAYEPASDGSSGDSLSSSPLPVSSPSPPPREPSSMSLPSIASLPHAPNSTIPSHRSDVGGVDPAVAVGSLDIDFRSPRRRRARRGGIISPQPNISAPNTPTAVSRAQDAAPAVPAEAPAVAAAPLPPAVAADAEAAPSLTLAVPAGTAPLGASSSRWMTSAAHATPEPTRDGQLAVPGEQPTPDLRTPSTYASSKPTTVTVKLQPSATEEPGAVAGELALPAGLAPVGIVRTRRTRRTVSEIYQRPDCRGSAGVQTDPPPLTGVFVQTVPPPGTAPGAELARVNARETWANKLAEMLRTADHAAEIEPAALVPTAALSGGPVRACLCVDADVSSLFCLTPAADVPSHIYGKPAEQKAPELLPAPALEQTSPTARGALLPASAAAKTANTVTVSAPAAALVQKVDEMLAARIDAPDGPFGPLTVAGAIAARNKATEDARAALERDVRAAAASIVNIDAVAAAPAAAASGPDAAAGGGPDADVSTIRMVHTLRAANAALQAKVESLAGLATAHLTPAGLAAVESQVKSECAPGSAAALQQGTAAAAAAFRAALSELHATAVDPSVCRSSGFAESGVQASPSIPPLATDEDLAAAAAVALLADSNISGDARTALASLGRSRHLGGVLRARLLAAVRGVDHAALASRVGDAAAAALPAMPAAAHAVAGSAAEAGLLQALAAVERSMSGDTAAPGAEGVLARLADQMGSRARGTPSAGRSPQHSPRHLDRVSSPQPLVEMPRPVATPVRRVRLAPPRPRTPGIGRRARPAMSLGPPKLPPLKIGS